MVGEAADGAQAVELARQQRPDVVLMDIRMPTMDGLEATRQITADQLLAGVRVLILTTFDPDEYAYQALQAGASGFLLKDTTRPTYWRRSGWWPPGRPWSPGGHPPADRGVHPPTRPDRWRRQRWQTLTDREREAPAQVAHGLSNEEIADRLQVSSATSKTYVGRLLEAGRPGPSPAGPSRMRPAW